MSKNEKLNSCLSTKIECSFSLLLSKQVAMEICSLYLERWMAPICSEKERKLR